MCLKMTNYPNWRGQGHVTSLNCGKYVIIKSETAHDRDIVAMED